MPNTFLTKSSGRSTFLRIAVLCLFSGFLLLPGLSLISTAHAQDFVPEKFDKSLIEDSLRDQEILREEMLLEQEILREEMEQIRLEIQRIMREIALSMKEEALRACEFFLKSACDDKIFPCNRGEFVRPTAVF